jgi:hypothetical protein
MIELPTATRRPEVATSAGSVPWRLSRGNLFVLACLAVGAAAAVRLVALYFVPDADVANSAVVWHELRERGYLALRQWRPTPDNWYLSAYPAHFSLFSLFGASPAVMRGIEVAQVLLAAGAGALICHARTRDRACALLVPLFVGLGHYAYGFAFLAHPLSHNLTNTYGLVCVYLYVVNTRRRELRLDLAIYALAVIAAVSDPWFLPAYYLPLLLATAYEVFHLRTRSRAALVVPLVTGVVLFSHAIERALHLPLAHFTFGTFGQIRSNAFWYLYGLGGALNLFLLEGTAPFVVSALLVLALFAVSISWTRRMGSVDVLLLLSVLGISGALVLGSTPGSPLSARFVVNIVYLAIGSVFVGALPGRRVLAVPLVLLALSGFGSHVGRPPPDRRLADEVAFLQSHDLHYGFGPYWGSQALAASWLSGWDTVLRPVTFDGRTGAVTFGGRGQTFDQWYEPDEGSGRARQFIAIASDGEECADLALCVRGVRRQYGDPSEVLQHGDITFLVYRKNLLDYTRVELSRAGHVLFGDGEPDPRWPGWSRAEGGYRWTEARPVLLFARGPGWRTAKFVMQASNYQPLAMCIRYGDAEIERLDLAPGDHEIRFTLVNVAPAEDTVRIALSFGPLKSRRQLGLGKDTRKLALQVRRLDYVFDEP